MKGIASGWRFWSWRTIAAAIRELVLGWLFTTPATSSVSTDEKVPMRSDPLRADHQRPRGWRGRGHVHLEDQVPHPAVGVLQGAPRKVDPGVGQGGGEQAGHGGVVEDDVRRNPVEGVPPDDIRIQRRRAGVEVGALEPEA